MSDNTKLRPEDLTAEERALWDTLAMWLVRSGDAQPHNAFSGSADAAETMILARRALFGSATEKAVCPNCKEETGENHVSSYNRDSFTCQPVTEKAQESAFPVGNCKVCGELVAPYNKHAKYEGGYTCQPAQPEPADSRQERADQIKSFLGGDDDEPARLEPAAQGEMPCPFCGAAPEVTRPSGRSEWIPESAGLGSAGWSGPVTEASCRACGVMRVPLVIWNSRTHSQPVDDEDLQFHINRAEYWIKERVLLGDQKETVLALKVAACKKQPVGAAISNLRQQAAPGKRPPSQPNCSRCGKPFVDGAYHHPKNVDVCGTCYAEMRPKVELPKVPVDALKRACATCSLDDCMTIAGWLDAVEGRK